MNENVANKGDLGALVEQLYFHCDSSNSPEPDFPQAGVEMKTTGVLKRDGKYVAKERLVLSMIDYHQIVLEEWETSTFIKKCGLMLLIFYLYEKDKAVFDRKFVPAPKLFSFPESDLPQLIMDWEAIRDKVKSGRAHELSEGDTFYLSACRKGSGGEREKLRSQPFSDMGAKSRAFSLKQKYVNRILDESSTSNELLAGHSGAGIEGATRSRVSKYLGMSVADIASHLNEARGGANDKLFYRRLAVGMLGGSGRSVAELDRADVELKTVRVKADWAPKESMSFPGFKYLDLINEQWEDSSFCQKLNKKFLFVVFRMGDDHVERLEAVFFWTMPYDDRLEARRVWELTKEHVGIDARFLPTSADSRVAHVRPKAANGNDKIETPQRTFLVKKCFWLNAGYIKEVILANAQNSPSFDSRHR